MKRRARTARFAKHRRMDVPLVDYTRLLVSIMVVGLVLALNILSWGTEHPYQTAVAKQLAVHTAMHAAMMPKMKQRDAYPCISLTNPSPA